MFLINRKCQILSTGNAGSDTNTTPQTTQPLQNCETVCDARVEKSSVSSVKISWRAWRPNSNTASSLQHSRVSTTGPLLFTSHTAHTHTPRSCTRASQEIPNSNQHRTTLYTYIHASNCFVIAVVARLVIASDWATVCVVVVCMCVYV